LHLTKRRSSGIVERQDTPAERKIISSPGGWNLVRGRYFRRLPRHARRVVFATNRKQPLMSILGHLFHRHQVPDNASSLFINWPGQSGTTYPYQIHPLDATFQAVPASYIYARQSDDGNWVPVYIAQTRALSQRLEGHVSLDDAIAQGATHIHVHLSTAGQGARCSEEHDLIELWRPVCNDVVGS